MRIEWNGKKLTKKRALFLCWKLWEWLGKTGSDDKYAWTHWEHHGGKVKSVSLQCLLCEYMRQNRTEEEKAGRDNSSCRNWCLLWDYWKQGCLSSSKKRSTYDLWLDAEEDKDRTKYARSIAAASKRRYKKL